MNDHITGTYTSLNPNVKTLYIKKKAQKNENLEN